MEYRGYEVLTVEPNRLDGEAPLLKWNVERLDNVTGPLDIERHALTPVRTRPFHWSLFSRGEIDGFLPWVERRRGRRNPFWAPTWQGDLRLLANMTSSNMLRVQNVGYVSRMFPHPARRHLALIRPNGTLTVHSVVNATTVSGEEERLTISPGVSLGERIGAEGSLVSFLCFCRLAADSVRLHWHGPEVAEARLDIVELPREVPA